MQYTVIVDINGQFVNKLRQPLPLCSAFKSEKGSSTASVELFNIVSSVSLCKVSCNIADMLSTGEFMCYVICGAPCRGYIMIPVSIFFFLSLELSNCWYCFASSETCRSINDLLSDPTKLTSYSSCVSGQDAQYVLLHRTNVLSLP